MPSFSFKTHRNSRRHYQRNILKAIEVWSIKDAIKAEESQAEQDFDFTQQTIADSQLAMIFAVCNDRKAAAQGKDKAPRR